MLKVTLGASGGTEKSLRGRGVAGRYSVTVRVAESVAPAPSVTVSTTSYVSLRPLILNESDPEAERPSPSVSSLSGGMVERILVESFPSFAPQGSRHSPCRPRRCRPPL
jgi:hypothetical protein